MGIQHEVYSLVESRGYLDNGKWTPEQLIARQVVKLIEELGELAEHVNGNGAGELDSLLLRARKAGRGAKIVFDSDLVENNLGTDADNLRHELADLQVVVFVLAELLGMDILKAARSKSWLDAPRGVTSNYDLHLR